MTLSSTASKTVYGGNGSTASFAIPFMFLCNDDIQVVLVNTNGVEQTLTQGTDYQLSGAGEQTGGVCSMTTPPASGESLVIRRVPAMIQEVDYVENDAFPAATHEAALDKLTMICQALAEKLDRTISFRISSAVTGVNLPEPSAGLLLGWNNTGNELVNKDVVSLGAMPTPIPIGMGGTDADNPTEALFNLGFGSAGLTVAGCEENPEVLAAIGAEPANPDILKADTADLLQTVYGDEAQPVTAVTVWNRNHQTWTLTGDAALNYDDTHMPYTGPYILHIYPAGHTVTFHASLKLADNLPDPDPDAGEIRIGFERFGGRISVVSLQNMAV